MCETKVKVRELTSWDIVEKACFYTTRAKDSFKVNKEKLYLSEHSPIRIHMFEITIEDIPTFAATHFVRHKWHSFVQSNREDRGGVKADRNTPVRMMIVASAADLIHIARQRLCSKSHEITKAIMLQIRREVEEISPELAEAMVPNCTYRGRCCEPTPCFKETKI